MQINVNSLHQTPVHKKDAEGVLLIDTLTGYVIPDQHDRPEWAEGLVLAQLAERHLWYTARLGDAYTADMSRPDMLAFEDLGWLTVAAGGEDDAELVEGYQDADAAFRMGVLANVLGVDLSAEDEGLAFASLKGIVTEVEIARDDRRTDAELHDLRIAQEGRFEAIEGGAEAKTGTNG